MDVAQNAYDMTTPLLRQVPQTALDAVFGASALVTSDLKLAVVGRSWDEFMARSGRSDLARNAMLGSSILLFFRNDEQRRVFESLLQSMHSDELGVHNQVVDLGTKDKPFYVQLHAQGLWQEGVFAGYFVHCLDITREHTNRLSLIERDREMQTGRETADKALQQTSSLQEKLRAAGEEIAQREAQLKKVTEKFMRTEKSAKEALERAEKSVEKSTRLQHELDKLKKQNSDSGKLLATLDAREAELAKLSTELKEAQETAAELHHELKTAREQQNDQAAQVTETAQEIADLRATIKELKETSSGARTDFASTQEKLATSASEIAKLQAELEQATETAATAAAELAETRKKLEESTSKCEELQAENQTLAETVRTAQDEHATLLEKFAKSKTVIEELEAALDEALNKPAPILDEVELVSSASNLLSYLTSRAAYLDISGNVLSGTGSFWEKLGAVPDKVIGKPFSKWLSKEDGEAFHEWLSDGKHNACELTSRDGSTWTACAVLDANGIWQAVLIEESVTVSADDAGLNGSRTPSQMRVLSRELADEFSNLLTGVLGHASLAAAEHDGAATREILEIEKSAREAAHLVRKLSALGGQGRHAHECDLAPTLQQFVKKLQPDFFGERPQIVLCDNACRVVAEVNGLRFVLDSISSHARDHLNGDSQVCYTLSHADAQACLSLSYDGDACYPAGWNEGLPPMISQNGWDLVFAREVVRGMGGELELTEDSGRSMLLMTLPLIRKALKV